MKMNWPVNKVKTLYTKSFTLRRRSAQRIPPRCAWCTFLYIFTLKIANKLAHKFSLWSAWYKPRSYLHRGLPRGALSWFLHASIFPLQRARLSVNLFFFFFFFFFC